MFVILSVLLISLVVGLTSAVFLFFIQYCSQQFQSYPALIWGLPIFGLITVYTYKTIGKDTKNTAHIFKHLHLEKNQYHFIGAPLIVIFASLSQLFGASTGREGAAVQFGASIADSIYLFLEKTKILISYKNRISKEWYIRMGIAAGFGGVFGLPLTGAVFANEIKYSVKNKGSFLFCLFTSYCSFFICKFLKAPHTNFPKPDLIKINIDFIFAYAAFTFSCVILAFVFNKSYHFLNGKIKSYNSYYVILFSTLLIVTLSEVILKNNRYNGLGLNLVFESFSTSNQITFFDWIGKFFYTIVSIISGLRGGEFVPLMSLGAILAAVIANLFSVSTAPIVSIGIVSFFSTTMSLPFTAAFAGLELFNFEIGLLCFFSTFVGSLITKKTKLYPDEL